MESSIIFSQTLRACVSMSVLCGCMCEHGVFVCVCVCMHMSVLMWTCAQADLFNLGDLMITGDCSNGIKRCLLLGRKIMINLDSILKRDITLPTKICLVKAMVFPVVMYGCESWTIKKAERRTIDAFGLWCWRFLRVPCTARRSSQSLLKEINPGSSLVGLMLKLNSNTLATWCEELTHLKRSWCWEDWLQEEKGMTEDEMVGWHHRLNGHGFGWTLAVGDGQGGLACCGSWGLKESDTTEQLNWTESEQKKERKENSKYSVLILFF